MSDRTYRIFIEVFEGDGERVGTVELKPRPGGADPSDSVMLVTGEMDLGRDTGFYLADFFLALSTDLRETAHRVGGDA